TYEAHPAAMMPSLLLIAIVVAPFLTALVAASLPSNARNAEAWISGLLAIGVLIAPLSLFPHVSGGGIIRHEIEWLPSLGLTIALGMGGFGWLFRVLVSGIGFLVVLYARYYMSPREPVPRFVALFLTFTGAMLGLVTARNVIQLAIFWELTSFLSFVLIGY